MPASSTVSIDDRVGGSKSPDVWSRSIAPLPVRVGMTEQHWTPTENERAHADRMVRAKAHGPLEIFERHTFVQTLENLAMGGLQSDTDVEIGAEEIAEPWALGCAESGMVLNRDRSKHPGAVGDCGVVLGRNRLAIEEVPTVVQLHVLRGWQAPQREVDLFGDGTGRQAFVRGVLPQVAHETPIGALVVGQKDRRDILDPAGGGPLRLDEKRVGTTRIGGVLGRP